MAFTYAAQPTFAFRSSSVFLIIFASIPIPAMTRKACRSRVKSDRSMLMMPRSTFLSDPANATSTEPGRSLRASSRFLASRFPVPDGTSAKGVLEP